MMTVRNWRISFLAHYTRDLQITNWHKQSVSTVPYDRPKAAPMD